MFHAGRPCAPPAQNVTKALGCVNPIVRPGGPCCPDPWPNSQRSPAGAPSVSTEESGTVEDGRKEGEGDERRGGEGLFVGDPSYKTIFGRQT